MEGILEDFNIAATGDFGPHRSHEKMRRLVEAHGGKFSPNITTEVTHLICSRKDFKNKVAMVRKARKMDYLAIVSLNWLEDSLMEKVPKRELGYLLQRQMRAAAAAKKAKKAMRKEKLKKAVDAFKKSCRDFQADMFSDGYHIFRDYTTFPYDITLARTNLVTNQNQRYQLRLYETHTEPCHYAAYYKFYTPRALPATRVLAPLGSAFHTAFLAFTDFFALKTKRTWDDRFMPVVQNGGEEEAEGDWELGTGKPFVYTPPDEGEPRGL